MEGRQLFGEVARKQTQEAGDFHIFLVVDALLIIAVAAKQLVRAFAREDNLHLLARFLRDKVERHGGGVRQRLVHVVLDDRGCVEKFLRRDFAAEIFDVDDFGQLLRVFQLGIFLLRVS